MAKVKESRTFIAEDGTEFGTQEEAERYEKLKTARVGFERATGNYARALAETFKTGDGEPFRIGGNYYCVYEYHDSEGYTWESFYLRDTTVDDDHRPAFVVLKRRDRALLETRYYFDMMFSLERDAQRKVLEIKKQRAGWLRDEIKELEKKVGA